MPRFLPAARAFRPRARASFAPLGLLTLDGDEAEQARGLFLEPARRAGGKVLKAFASPGRP